MTPMLLWEECRAEHADRQTYAYSQFCDNYRRFARQLKRSMRQIHRAGGKLFIDYAGPTIALTDGSRAHIFVAALGASSGFGANRLGESVKVLSLTIWWSVMSKREGLEALFEGRHFDREIIILCVRRYLRYKLSLRDLVEMMAERGLSLVHGFPALRQNGADLADRPRG
ncbi:hypothetical protein [Caballeronia sordidicola]|nr:hypothetical protein [Caballeronia sordidicola]